jgi:hypothetical protein
MQRVIAVAAIEGIIPLIAIDVIAAAGACQAVIIIRAKEVLDVEQRVGAATAGVLRASQAEVDRDTRQNDAVADNIDAIPAIEHIIASAGGLERVAIAAAEPIIARSADEGVVTISALKRVIPIAAYEAIIAQIAKQAVITVAANDCIIAATAID